MNKKSGTAFKTTLPQSPMQISAPDLMLIQQRIDQLEASINEESQHLNIKETSKQPIYRELISFLMMYFFLNYDCFVSSSYLKSKSNLLNQARKENHQE